jgi:S-adenosylmethionine-diacylgycerolhomoserine-N-methlytransferase
MSGAAESAALLAHQGFLDRYYRVTRHVYDATRKYYLLGRDRALEQLLCEPWRSLVEVGPGTGRNLRHLHARRPSARYGGLEASREMLAHAEARCRFARFAHGFAEGADLSAVLGERPDRILFSYALSMIGEPERALANAERALAPGGEIVIVDFGSLDGLPSPLRRRFERFLARFHVRTALLASLERADAYEVGPLGYFEIARLRARTALELEVREPPVERSF